MLRRQYSGARNKLDLNNRVQVRIVRKRLNVSGQQLTSLVRTAGDSIAGRQQGSECSTASYASRRPNAFAEVISLAREREVAA
jgi:hypothetical protein